MSLDSNFPKKDTQEPGTGAMPPVTADFTVRSTNDAYDAADKLFEHARTSFEHGDDLKLDQFLSQVMALEIQEINLGDTDETIDKNLSESPLFQGLAADSEYDTSYVAYVNKWLEDVLMEFQFQEDDNDIAATQFSGTYKADLVADALVDARRKEESRAQNFYFMSYLNESIKNRALLNEQQLVHED
ncbi:MAG: hypothetical protein COB36_02115 [Alphaproteobacteria bacterium]|nr:MAG: hypothetical protein COB36_02115 [Alphaproteobacteria bacterium]